MEHMGKMVSLKNPPPKKESKCEPCCGLGMSDMYPYSTRLELNDDLSRKFKALKDCKVGDQFRVEAMGTVTAVSENERREPGSKDTKSDYRVTIQLTNASIEPDEDGETDAGFDAGAKTDEDKD